MWVETERFEVVDDQGVRNLVIAMRSALDEQDGSSACQTMYFLSDGTNVKALTDGTFLIERPQRIAKRATPL